MNITKKKIDRALKGAIAALPAISYLRRRRRQSFAAYILGGLGVALASSLAALMYVSPRTRKRALTAAKDTYGKVNAKLDELRSKSTASQMANGFVDHSEYPTTTGL